MEEIRQSNIKAEIPPNFVSSLSDIIMEGAPSYIVDLLRQQVDDLTQVVYTKGFTTDDLRIKLTGL